MKIDRRCPQAVVTEQELNGPQIRARFQQMSCEAVTQRVRGNRFGESGSHSRSVTDPSDPIARDGISGPVSDKEIGVRFVGLPIFPEQLEQFGREHDKAIFAPFALARGQMEEIGMRCERLEIRGLAGEVGSYLEWLIKQAGGKIEIFSPEAQEE